MDKHNSKPKAKPLSASKKKPVSELVTHYVDQLAMALGQMIPTERTLLYVRALSDLTEQQLAHGFDKALKLFKPEFGKTFPAPAEIREWGFQWRSAEHAETRLLLDRGDKPPDWEPLDEGEFQEILKKSNLRSFPGGKRG